MDFIHNTYMRHSASMNLKNVAIAYRKLVHNVRLWSLGEKLSSFDHIIYNDARVADTMTNFPIVYLRRNGR